MFNIIMNEMNGCNIVSRRESPRYYVILCASFFESDLTDSFAVFSLLAVADNMSKERKCEMKGTGKRILSVSLSVMMALGMPSGTFAATPDEAAAGQVSEAEVPAAEPEVTQEVSQQAAEEPKAEENVEKEKNEEQKVEAKKEQESVTEPTAEPAAQPEEVKNNENTNAETKPEKAQPDVQVTKAELVETKEKCWVTVYTDSDVYDQLYIGKKEDTEKTSVIAGEKDLNGKYKFQFAVSEEKLGSKLQIVPGIKESGEWYTKQDLFCQVPERTQKEDSAKPSEKPAPSEAPSTEPVVSTIPSVPDMASPNTEKSQVIKEDGSEFKMFKVSSFEAKTVGNKIELSLKTKNVSFDKIYFGMNADAEKTSTINGTWTETEQEWQFQFNVDRNKSGKAIPIVLGKKDGTWFSKYQLYLTIPEEAMKSPDVTKSQVIKEDGSIFKMFKISSAEVKSAENTMELTVKTANSSFDKLYFGWNEDTEKKPTVNGTLTGKEWTFHFSVDKKKAGKAIPVVLGKPDGTWFNKYQLFLTIPEEKNSGETEVPTTPVTPTKPAPSTAPSQPARPAGVPADGVYTTTAETGTMMFRVVEIILTVKNGKMSAEITLSGTGYDYLYMGTAAEAAGNESQWIGFKDKEKSYIEDGEEKTGRSYIIPISTLDTPLAMASHSVKRDKWYDRSITVSSNNLKKISSGEAGNGEGGSLNPTPTVVETATKDSVKDTTPAEESKSESDTSGSTSQVNSKTKLKDGVYTPDKFTWSGGTGKVNITCDKVTIKNGQALATIAFSSSAYQYVKANGKKYFPTHTGGKSIFVIPVELNKNNKIIGMTTKMSTAHEIEYSIMVYLAAADGDGSGAAAGEGNGTNFGSKDKLDEKAPDIIGLKYKSETKLDYADYFKIYHYDDDITLLEIDLSKDTDKDPEKLEKDAQDKDTADTDNKKDTKKTSKSGKKKVAKITIKRNDEEKKTTDTQSVAYNDEGEAAVQTQEEITADLYKAKVVKYLIVPEDSDAELPVGIEKEMIVVKLPIKHAYVDSEESIDTLETLKLLKKVKAVGFDQDETDIDAVNKGLEEEKMVYAGAADDLKFRELVKNKIDFAIVSSEVLPGSKTAEDAKEKGSDTDSKKNSDSKNQKKADVKDVDDKSTVTDSKKTTDSSDENEEEAVLDQLADNFATLGIPMLIDRSADEESDLGKAEWLKVYGAFFGCSDKTDKLYDKAVKAAKSKK